MRASPGFEDDLPRFVALSAEALVFVNALRAALDDPASPADNGSQLLVIADQCQSTLQGIRKRALTVGTSLHLSYLLARSEQCPVSYTHLDVYKRQVVLPLRLAMNPARVPSASGTAV